MLLHIVLFLMLWVIFAGFLFVLLNPLLKRVSKEVREMGTKVVRVGLCANGALGTCLGWL